MCRPKNQPSPNQPSPPRDPLPPRPALVVSLTPFLAFRASSLLRAPVRSPMPTPLSTSGIVETTRTALSFGPRCKTWTYFKFAAFYRIRYLSTGCTSKGRRSISRPFYLVFLRISLIWSRPIKYSRYLSGITTRMVVVTLMIFALCESCRFVYQGMQSYMLTFILLLLLTFINYYLK